MKSTGFCQHFDRATPVSTPPSPAWIAGRLQSGSARGSGGAVACHSAVGRSSGVESWQANGAPDVGVGEGIGSIVLHVAPAVEERDIGAGRFLSAGFEAGGEVGDADGTNVALAVVGEALNLEA